MNEDDLSNTFFRFMDGAATDPAHQTETSMLPIVCIRTYPTRIDAEAAKNILEAARIPAIVEVDDCGGAHPYLVTTSGGAKLMVRQADVERAEQTLKDRGH